MPVVPADRTRRADGARRPALEYRQVARDSTFGHLLVHDVSVGQAALRTGSGVVADLDAEGGPRRYPPPTRLGAGQRAEVRGEVRMRGRRGARAGGAAARGRGSRAGGVMIGFTGGRHKAQADHEGCHGERPRTGREALLGVEVAEPQCGSSRPRSRSAALAVAGRRRCSVTGVAHHLKVTDRYRHMGDTPAARAEGAGEICRAECGGCWDVAGVVAGTGGD